MRRIPFKHILSRFAGLLALGCIFALSSLAAPTVTVTASAQSILGTTQTVSMTVTLIDPNTTGMLKAGAVVVTNFTATSSSATTVSVGPIYGNDVIVDGFGNLNQTYYKVQVFPVSNGIIASTPALQNFYAFIGSGTIDVSTATPLSPSFQTGTSGNVVLPGNITVSGSITGATLSISGAATLPVLTATSPVINGTPSGTGIPTVTLKKGTGIGNYTTTSTTLVVVDSTNLCYTVTIPVGWKLAVRVSANLGTNTAPVLANAALTDNASCSTANAGILASETMQGPATGTGVPFSLDWVINGDGNSHNIALQFDTNNAADAATMGNASAAFLPKMVFLLTPSN